MNITIKVPEYSVNMHTTYTTDLLINNQIKKFPLLIIDKDSYIVELQLSNLFVSSYDQYFDRV